MVKHVDENNKEIGGILRSEVRAKNLFHRASFAFIQNQKDGKFIIQKRTKTKDYCPGFWDLTTGGVVGAGEDDDVSAEREIEEEIGLTGHKLTRAATIRIPGDNLFGNLYFLKLEDVKR